MIYDLFIYRKAKIIDIENIKASLSDIDEVENLYNDISDFLIA